MAEITHDGLSVCDDCALIVANGECGDETESEAHAARIQARWGDLTAGLTLACEEGCEGWFSWSPCEGCGSPLGGYRHPAVVLS